MSPTPPLHGRVAVVTGAAGLLGRQHVAALLDAGATVGLIDTNAGAVRSLANEIDEERPGSAIACVANVVDSGELEEAREAIERLAGPVEILVNNAAIDDPFRESPAEAESAESFSLDSFRRIVDVNVCGVFLPCKVFGTGMVDRRAGSIINVASTYALVGPDPAIYRRDDGTIAFTKSPAYSASKGAVVALTRHLAAAWGESGVRVNALCPGGVDNSQPDYFRRSYSRRTPLGRMADPADYRGAIVFLADSASSYMTGSVLVIDGGYTAW
jgi:NAD(P)-dependent dehydrogenase (short-subunit alcohol dehydrogenase family)